MDTEKSQTSPAPKTSRRGLWIGQLVAVTVSALLSSCGKGPAASEPASSVTVSVAKVEREDLIKEKPLPAEFRPFAEVELHAKVSGYVDKMNVDFGDKVKAGQLLATLEVPELGDELRNARAVEQRTDADYTNAHLIFQRIQEVNKEHPNLVAQQDLDTARAKEDSAAAAIASAKADAFPDTKPWSITRRSPRPSMV